MNIIKSIFEARRELKLRESDVHTIEEDPNFWPKKKEYHNSIGKNCEECDNKWCKNKEVKT